MLHVLHLFFIPNTCLITYTTGLLIFLNGSRRKWTFNIYHIIGILLRIKYELSSCQLWNTWLCFYARYLLSCTTQLQASTLLEPYLNLRFKTLVNFFKNLPISYNIIKLDVTCVCTLIFWCLFLRKLYQINFFLEAWPIFGRGTRLQSSFLGPFILGVNYYILKNIYFWKSDEFLSNKHVIHWKNTVYQIVFEKMKKI
jgi:hypothetical protein